MKAFLLYRHHVPSDPLFCHSGEPNMEETKWADVSYLFFLNDFLSRKLNSVTHVVTNSYGISV